MKLSDFYPKFNDMCRELAIDIDFNVLEQQYVFEGSGKYITPAELEYIQQNLSQIEYVGMCFKDNLILITIKPFTLSAIKFNLGPREK